MDQPTQELHIGTRRSRQRTPALCSRPTGSLDSDRSNAGRCEPVADMRGRRLHRHDRACGAAPASPALGEFRGPAALSWVRSSASVRSRDDCFSATRPGAAPTTGAVVMRGPGSPPPPDPDARFRPRLSHKPSGSSTFCASTRKRRFRREPFRSRRVRFDRLRRSCEVGEKCRCHFGTAALVCATASPRRSSPTSARSGASQQPWHARDRAAPDAWFRAAGGRRGAPTWPRFRCERGTV